MTSHLPFFNITPGEAQESCQLLLDLSFHWKLANKSSLAIIHLVHMENFPKNNISYPLIRTSTRFSANFAKFLRIPFSQNTPLRLLLPLENTEIKLTHGRQNPSWNGIPEFLDSRRWTLDSGLWTLEARLRTLGIGCWILDVGEKAIICSFDLIFR